MIQNRDKITRVEGLCASLRRRLHALLAPRLGTRIVYVHRTRIGGVAVQHVDGVIELREVARRVRSVKWSASKREVELIFKLRDYDGANGEDNSAITTSGRPFQSSAL